MKKTEPVINPSRLERFTLRLMIGIGAICMVLFLREILATTAEYAILHGMLVATFIFGCLKIAHEWVHYWCIMVPDTPKSDKRFTVDIFTTFCAGEPYEMIRETLIAIKAIKYPHQTFLCDEADDPYLKNLCDELGVVHVTRTLKVDAKAGNINNALQFSNAEICLILDPDHVPSPDFLDTVIPHFSDPDVGFVQVVQAYKNQDQGLVAKGAAQQTYQFYGPIMMTMNKYGTVLAIGANCTFRRAALDSIGGHAAGLAEDMHTAMQLHAKGWKSVYVPAVVARGLVPSTLSAYYSQQLKWARGVFELLVTSYPKLFPKFSWQQKLHYGVIPMYYLSGVFILINFLIPILSLILNTSPISFDFLNFITIGFPLFVAIMLIRLFVQKWVMEEEERGVHMVGGLLMIGTWWVFVVGLVYTLLRKKVPYIPTPKGNDGDNNWWINVPNLLTITASIAAIVYGLSNDWNPYNLIMAGFAAINCAILSFSIAASRQYQFRRFKKRYWIVRAPMAVVAELKKSFWKFRRRVYRGIRSTALMLTILGICYTAYKINTASVGVELPTGPQPRRDIVIPGIFTSLQSDGLTSISDVNILAEQGDISFGIVSCYVPWGDEPQCNLPASLLDSIYSVDAIPMITWEPWQNLFHQRERGDEQFEDKKVFLAILEGDYDAYLARFSQQVNALNRPVFIRFAHEADNPQYPWSATGENTADAFKKAWQYVHRYFRNHHVYNAIWVWNPWKPEAVKTYFPGKEYVDWIGVTSLNYGALNDDGKWYSMRDLYAPFHNQTIFKSGIPVMVAEMGSLPAAGGQNEWFRSAFREMSGRFPEIKSIVFFNPKVDHNIPGSRKGVGYLDWRIAHADSLGVALKKERWQTHWLTNRPLKRFEHASSSGGRALPFTSALLSSIKGVNYAKGQNWSTNDKVLRKKDIAADFVEMKKVGFNTVKHYGPSVYDRNILRVAQQETINVSYGFWLPDHLDYMSDGKELNEYETRVLRTVKSLKDNKNIVMWNISNNPLKGMSYRYFKPDFNYHREAYTGWLKQLIADMKAIDPKRPISVDIDIDASLEEQAHWLHYHIPDIDCFGLVEGNDTDAETGWDIPLPYMFSKMGARDYLALPTQEIGVFITNWQDERTPRAMVLDGLLDDVGRSKMERYRLANRWVGAAVPEELPELKILRPAETIDDGQSVTFGLLVRDGKGWRLLNEPEDRLKLEWKLIKMNDYGNPLESMPLGEGINVTFQFHGNLMNHKIALYASNDTQVDVIQSDLNTPLYPSQWTEEAWSSFKLNELSD